VIGSVKNNSGIFTTPKEIKTSLVSKEIQLIINWYTFFLVFPSTNILGNSLTFYIFLSFVIGTGNFWTKKFKGSLKGFFASIN
jgi:hypothetical protein